jgi:hypothetical protein
MVEKPSGNNSYQFRTDQFRTDQASTEFDRLPDSFPHGCYQAPSVDLSQQDSNTLLLNFLIQQDRGQGLEAEGRIAYRLLAVHNYTSSDVCGCVMPFEIG